MKVHLLYPDQDFDFDATLPPGHQDLIQDLELARLFAVMANGDKFLSEISARVLLTSVRDVHAIRYRQQVIADCLAQPEVIRQMYAVAVAALADKRQLWGGYGGSFQNPSSNLSGAVSHLGAYVVRLRELRQIADDHAGKFRSAGLTTLFATVHRDLDDEYFEEIDDHLRRLRFRGGVLISAQLGRDNSGTGFVLRAPEQARRALGRTPRDQSAHHLLIQHLAPRRGRRPDPHRPDQPGDQPGRQRCRAVRRPHRQLLHHASGRAGLLCGLPQPRRSAHGQGGPDHSPRACRGVIAGVLVRGPARRVP